MSRKNKLMIAAAIAAVLLFVVSGVARCSLATEEEQAVEQAAETTYEMQGSEVWQGSEPVTIEDDSSFESLIGTSWVGMEDPTLTLAIVDGALVEGKDGVNTVTYFTIDSEEEKDGTLTATILASKSMTEAASPVVITVADEAGRTIIRSDALASAYASVQTEAKTLSFSGVTSKLEESLGVDTAKIEAAVASRAAAVSPDATRAIWDAEVWIDFANNTATTSFTLEDGASTIVSVTRAADGTVEAL